MFEIDDWMDDNGCYYFKQSSLTKEEVLILWQMSESVSKKRGYGIVSFKKDKLVFNPYPFYLDLDLKLWLMKFIGRLEDRLDKEGYFNQADDESRTMQKIPYYNAYEH